MKIIAITQARYGSSRLPGKILKKINNKTLLEIHLERVIKSKKVDRVIVATTHEPEAKEIIRIAQLCGCYAFQGSMNDVLDRYYQAAKNENADYVVRITSDCPLIDAQLIDDIIDECINAGYDYCSNTLSLSFPDGLDVEVFKYSVLEKAWNDATIPSDREHVTSYIWRNSTHNGGKIFTSHNFANEINFSLFRLTVDELEDYELIAKLVMKIGYEKSWKEYVLFIQEHYDLFILNKHLERNAGYTKSLNEDKNDNKQN